MNYFALREDIKRIYEYYDPFIKAASSFERASTYMKLAEQEAFEASIKWGFATRKETPKQCNEQK